MFNKLHKVILNCYTSLGLFIWLMVKHPSDILFYFVWISSLKKRNKQNLLLEDRPWLTFKAIKWLNLYLKREMKVFEYGSGGSTIFLAKRVRSLISVEHDESWHRLVNDLLKRMKYSNVNYILLKPKRVLGIEKDVSDPDTYISGFKEEYKDLDFSEYVKIIENYSDNSFDLILIDGRSRPSCIKHATKKLKQNGVIILDNAERERYKLAKIQYLSNFKSKCFFGIGPYSLTPWETSIYFKSSN